MNKKNSGFSLVELIVVIAIMAVLVGVLAPAYLKYVEKSRKSTDVSAISDIITAASTVATDVEYDVPANTYFNIKVTTKGTATLGVGAATTSDEASDSYAKALKGWCSVASVDQTKGYKFKSKEFSDGNTQTISGKVENSGSVTWAKPTGDGVFSAMVSYSKDFGSKFCG